MYAQQPSRRPSPNSKYRVYVTFIFFIESVYSSLLLFLRECGDAILVHIDSFIHTCPQTYENAFLYTFFPCILYVSTLSTYSNTSMLVNCLVSAFFRLDVTNTACICSFQGVITVQIPQPNPSSEDRYCPSPPAVAEDRRQNTTRLRVIIVHLSMYNREICAYAGRPV